MFPDQSAPLLVQRRLPEVGFEFMSRKDSRLTLLTDMQPQWLVNLERSGYRVGRSFHRPSVSRASAPDSANGRAAGEEGRKEEEAVGFAG